MAINHQMETSTTMTTDTEILAELEALGSEQTRKTNRRHGVGENQFGVLHSAFGKLKKRIKTDHDLALKLWESGNYDARILAMMIADPQKADSDTLERWANDLENYALSAALSTYVSRTPLARQKAEQWIESDSEWSATMGWNILGALAASDPTLPDSYFEALLKRIERDLHSSQNWVRYAMNNALIAIGIRNEALEEKAFATAEHIGKVIVDHGETYCKTPDAIPYIQKAKEHAEEGKLHVLRNRRALR